MGSISSASDSTSHHTLIANVSSLFGAIVLLNQMWSHASLEHTVLTTAGAGLSVYLILAVGYAAACGVVAYAPSDEADEEKEADKVPSGAAPEGDPAAAESSGSSSTSSAV